MAQVINSTDELTFILTSYGLSRVAEAISDPTVELYISKIKVGDANFEYYVPTLDDFPPPTGDSYPDLRHLIPDGEFYIVEKNLLEDGMTVSFHAVIPETFQNAEIREVGIYETINGQDRLFAVSTQQPLLKPFINLHYLISVDYFAFLKSQNLATIYDRIILDPESQLVTEEDLDNLMSTILFTENNLMDQIHDNTRIIGLNRSQQLQERISADTVKYSHNAVVSNYSTVLNYVDSASSVVGYWAFEYPLTPAIQSVIKDIGIKGNNLSTNKNINLYTQTYKGITSFLSFGKNDYFYLNDSDSSLDFVDPLTLKDTPFTVIAALKPNSTEGTRTILGRSDYSSTDKHVFEVNELPQGSIEIKLFSDSSNYVTFTSDTSIVGDTVHSLIFSYDPENVSVLAYLKGRRINLTKSQTGAFTTMARGTNLPLYSCIINSSENKDQCINSEVGIISVMKTGLSDEELRTVALSLEAAIGNNPCVELYQ